MAYTPGRFYKGKIKGNESSIVVISLFDDEVYGLITRSGHSNVVIGNTPSLRRNSFMLFQDEDVEAPPFVCGTAELPHWAEKIENPNVGFRSNTSVTRCVNVYFEAGNNLFISKGGESGAANFISGIFNATSTLYSAESISTSISEIKVWTTAEPYSTDPGTALTDFGNALGGHFNGNIGHFVRLNSGSYSGIAWVGALCSSVPYAYSEIASSYSSYPTYSWNVNVITHEMGHNLGSPHTQSCTWPGGPIDNCVQQEGSCAPGPTPPAGGGTIMSYCHLTGIGIKFSNGFGPLPGNKIRDGVNNATCLGTCGSSGGGSTTTTLPDLQTTSITISPATITTLSQAINIAFSTSNLGSAAASSVSRVYLSSDNSLSSNDATVTDVTLPSINASTLVTASFNYTLPNSTLAGTYYIIVCADVLNTISESSESNNCKSVTLTYSPSNPNPNPTPVPTSPDLELTVSSTLPSVISPGLGISINGSVKNIGDAAAASSELSIVLSNDNFFSSNDIILFNNTVSSLTINGSSNFVSNVTIPSVLSSSSYFIIICSDPSNAISEKNEGNNCITTAVTVENPKPDLIINNLSLGTNPVPTGSAFSVSYTLQNIGTLASGSTSVGLYLSKNNSTYEASDQLLNEKIFSLGTGAASSLYEQFQVTSKLDPGNYFLIVCADNKNQIQESSESNNCSSIAINISNPIPDLTIELVNEPFEILTNKEQKITLRVKNIGLMKSEVSTSASLYFTPSGNIDASATFIGSMVVPPLNLNVVLDTTFSFTILSETLEGIRYFAYCVDQANKVPESNEVNNCNISAVSVIIPLPDLACISSAKFNTPVPRGASFKFPFRMTNVGKINAPSSLTEYYLSTKPFNKSGYRFPTDTVEALAEGDTISKNVNLFIPANVVAGDYYITVCVDYNNKIKENAEINNCQSIRLTVRKQYPDLEIAALSLTDSTVYTASTATVLLSVKNKGEIQAYNVKLKVLLFSNSNKDTTKIIDFKLDSLVANGARDTLLKIFMDKSFGTQNITVTAYADPDATIFESDETNNSASLKIQISNPLPDLIPAFLSISDSLLQSGREYSLSGLIMNNGKAKADSFNVALTLVDSLGKTLVTLISVKEKSLSIELSDTINPTFKIPSAIITGSYYLKLNVNADKKVLESDQSNNITLSSIQIIHSLPDVYVEQIETPDSLIKGTQIQVRFIIKNIGYGEMPENTNDIILSRSLNGNLENHSIGTITLPQLESGQTIDLKSLVQIPADMASDVYEMILFVDNQNKIEEVSKENNLAEQSVVIPDTKTDLNHTGLQLEQGSNVQQGKQLSINHFIKNDGETPAGAFEISYLLKKHLSDPDALYKFKSHRCLDTILGGKMMEVFSSVNIPDTLQPGTYVLSSCLDELNEIAETNEGNNCSQILITVERHLSFSTSVVAQPIFTSIKMYPNPAKEWIEIAGTTKHNQEKLNLEIKDFTGRVVSRFNFNAVDKLQYQMDISALAHGVYLLEMTTKQGTWKQTFVKL
ncbi:MAG: CARDB domain-containing protein [Saprospiraceae bacterium]